MKHTKLKLLSLLIVALIACRLPAAAQVRELPSPAGAASGQPNLTVGSDGRVYLSWIDRLADKRVALRFAVRQGDGWSEPQTIAEGANWFVNWADFPSLIVLPDGSPAAHWLAKNGEQTFDYQVNIARSFDGGKTWSKPVVPHRDGKQAEHGFVSLLALNDGLLGAVWLDGREMSGHGHGEMTLRFAALRRDGTLEQEALLDARVCECCQTSAAMTADGPIIVYRDRSQTEIRDIYVLRWRAGKWSEPRPVFRDEWKLNGCPVNGPSIAASGKRAAVAWFTMAGNTARVRLAFSKDAGETFGAPIAVDDGQPIGRVETLLLPDGSALVCWLEKIDGGGEVRVRRVWSSGKRGPAITVAPTGTARSNGFPQMALAGGKLVFAWTGAKVLTAEMGMSEK